MDRFKSVSKVSGMISTPDSYMANLGRVFSTGRILCNYRCGAGVVKIFAVSLYTMEYAGSFYLFTDNCIGIPLFPFVVLVSFQGHSV